MAKRLVKISLAMKFRLLLGFAVLGIIAAALVAPWFFLELLREQGAERPGAELTRLRLNEWMRDHIRADAPPSTVARLYTTGAGLEGRAGPTVVRVGPGRPATSLDAPALKALKAFSEDPSQTMAVVRTQDRDNRMGYRSFRAVRVDSSCIGCHGTEARAAVRFAPDELVGMIDVAMPGAIALESLAWWTRGAFIVGAGMAGLLALVLFSIIAQYLVIRPVRHLHTVTDKVGEGDLAVRSGLKTGDELQRLGESFNEMLDAISTQHDQLRAANRALDLKLSEVAQANVSLFQANKVKSEFVANVSHELRTPLNSIIGFSDLLTESDDPRIQRYGANIGRSAKSLMGMINDLLDLAKIEAGKSDVRLDKVSLTETCRTLAALMKPLADKQQLELATELDAELPLVTTDGGKLQQILYNLLSNAIKFTPPSGKITLSVERRKHHTNGHTGDEVAVSVTDTGPGIPEADQEHIFEKFYQADRSLTKQVPGTGLGLAIAKDLSGLLGGRLNLRSSPGEGTTFTLVIPVDAGPVLAARNRPAGEDSAPDANA